MTRKRVTRLTQSDIEASLIRLGIAYKSSSNLPGSFQFASLRAPCEFGIYFMEGLQALPKEIHSSLILTNEEPVALDDGNAYLHVESPQKTFYRLMRLSYPEPAESGIHATAVISPDAVVPDDCLIGPYCIIETDVSIGHQCRLDSHVVLKAGSVLGNRVTIEPHSTIGATGVAWIWDIEGGGRVMQPQIGGVRIGDDVFIGSDVSIVRGSVNEDTEIADGTVIAHGSKIGHGCRLGQRVHLANNVSLAGNVDVGDRVFWGSGSVARPRVTIAADVIVGAGSVVVGDIDAPGSIVYGVPARPMKDSKGRYTGVPALPEKGKHGH